MPEVAENPVKTEVNPFDDNNTGKIELPPNEVKEIKGEEKVVETVKSEEKKDPVIEEKDEKIKEEKPVVTKTNEPEKIPTATPKDIPARTEEEKKDIKPAEPVFANKFSEQMFEALKEGKEDVVLELLNKKSVLKNIDKLPPADIIKLQLKNENKDYTPQEVEDLFNETFTAPEKPTFDELKETEEEFKIREDKYNDKLARFERKIERESKNSKAELLKLQQDLVLPDISKPEAKIKEPTQEELEATEKATEQAREKYLTSIDEGLNDFKSIEAVFKDKDVEIKSEYKISAEERKDLKETMENFNLEQFIQERWLTKDGKFNTAQQAKDIFLLTQGEKAIAKIVNEVGTRRYAEAIKSQKNIDYSGTQRSGNFLPTATEQMDQMAEFFLKNN